jgi:DNA-binding winged helix-turn-helix (wHTH) protein
MLQPDSGPPILRFDVYAVDLRAGELFRNGRKIKLQEQPFQILAILLEHPGEVVTREELRERLWSKDTFVDFEHSLNTAIKKLRRALNDGAEKPRFIETLRRRGYRFTACFAENPETPSQPKSAAVSYLVGKVFALRNESTGNLLSLPIDEMAFKEKQKLEAADDDLGLSLLFADGKVLMVQTGTRVKVLDVRTASSSCEVRILEGEHTARTAIAPFNCLLSDPQESGVAATARKLH